MSAEPRPNPWMRLAWGSIVLTLGIIFWLDRIDRIDARDYLEWWPVAAIVIGLAHLPRRRWGGAVAWLAVGGFFLLERLGAADVELWRLVALWPLMLTIGGVTLIMQALRRRSGTTFNTTAVMAGNVLTLGSQPLSGGSAVAVMGGVTIDLGSVRPEAGDVVVDVLAFWGGIDVRVPRGWRIESRVAEVLGGLEDKTVAPADNAPRLVLRGSAIMGGVSVTHPVQEGA
jgi:hypothetical protein